mmetsp:Transcript_73839/g.130190  ORF Transcript_73839/g.130190 Transcript_73839/m.130190 type:complete len:621 (-) Transcript_73839:2158-4020(-)
MDFIDVGLCIPLLAYGPRTGHEHTNPNSSSLNSRRGSLCNPDTDMQRYGLFDQSMSNMKGGSFMHVDSNVSAAITEELISNNSFNLEPCISAGNLSSASSWRTSNYTEYDNECELDGLEHIPSMRSMPSIHNMKSMVSMHSMNDMKQQNKPYIHEPSTLEQCTNPFMKMKAASNARRYATPHTQDVSSLEWIPRMPPMGSLHGPNPKAHIIEHHEPEALDRVPSMHFAHHLNDIPSINSPVRAAAQGALSLPTQARHYELEPDARHLTSCKVGMNAQPWVYSNESEAQEPETLHCIRSMPVMPSMQPQSVQDPQALVQTLSNPMAASLWQPRNGMDPQPQVHFLDRSNARPPNRAPEPPASHQTVKGPRFAPDPLEDLNATLEQWANGHALTVEPPRLPMLPDDPSEDELFHTGHNHLGNTSCLAWLLRQSQAEDAKEQEDTMSEPVAQSSLERMTLQNMMAQSMDSHTDNPVSPLLVPNAGSLDMFDAPILVANLLEVSRRDDDLSPADGKPLPAAAPAPAIAQEVSKAAEVKHKDSAPEEKQKVKNRGRPDGKFPIHLGGRCTHTAHWSRLRGKRGHAYFFCKYCGLGWRLPPKEVAALENAKEAANLQDEDGNGEQA